MNGKTDHKHGFALTSAAVIEMANSEQFEKHMFNIEGSEGHDSGALTPEQQLQLNQFKVHVMLHV